VSYISKQNKNLMALSLLAGGASVLSVGSVSADTFKEYKAGDFDLTKQATKADYPVMFDRPTGVNASALGNAIVNLGTSSDLYKKAVVEVPELKDPSIVNSLLDKAMNGDKSARATIVKLINFYNSLGGTQITTQSGQKYTVENLDEPINTIAVAFTNGDSASNKKVSTTIQGKFGAVKTTGDVMKAIDTYGAGISDKYQKAFDSYDAKLKAQGADLSKLTSYEAIKPVLDSYEGMYADGASIIRKSVLAESGTTEAAVAFFESAVITGGNNNGDNGSTEKNEVKRVTKFVDKSTGKELDKSVEGEDFVNAHPIKEYTHVDTKTEGNTRTHYYEKTPEKKVITKWIDKDTGKDVKPPQEGTHEKGKDVDGYTYVTTIKDKDGNIVHEYVKTPEKKVVRTHWYDANNPKEPLLPAREGSFPDNDGKSDIEGYKLKGEPIVITEEIAKGLNKDSPFKVGDTVNLYEKVEAPKTNTRWVDEATGKDIPGHEPKEGSFPDKEGDDVPGYTLVSTHTDDKGNVVNTYTKKPVETKVITHWIDKATGKDIQGHEPKEGAFPDKEGDDVKGYKFVETVEETDKDGNKVIKNIYEVDAAKVTTRYITKSDRKRIVDDVEGKEFAKEIDFSKDKDPEKRKLKLVGVETSKDGKTKTYIYDVQETPKAETPKTEKPVEKPQGKQLPQTGDSNIPVEAGLVALATGIALARTRRKESK
jgi:surface repeat SSSPR-51 protein